MLSSQFSGLTGEVIDYLSLTGHFESMARGVIDSTDLVYVLTIVLTGLLLAGFSLSKRNLD